MAITITKYATPGTRFSYEPGRSGSFKQLFLVSGLDPSNADNPAAACFATDQATGFFIPLYGSAHPTVTNFFVNAFEAYPFPEKSLTQVMVEVIYRPPEFLPGTTLIEIIGSSGTKVISRWASGPQKGQPILVGYSPNGYSFQPQIDPNDAATWAAQGFGRFTCLATLKTLDPGTILRFVRRETSSPLSKSYAYRRHRNKTTWQGQPAGVWLCRKFDGTNFAQGGSLVAPSLYNVVYEFEADPVNLWTQYPTYRDALTGTTPQDINILAATYNGYTQACPYDDAEFAALNLPSAL